MEKYKDLGYGSSKSRKTAHQRPVVHFCHFLSQIKNVKRVGGSALPRGSKLGSYPAAPGSNPSIPPKNYEEKLAVLQRLIKGNGLSKLDNNGLKMVIKHI